MRLALLCAFAAAVALVAAAEANRDDEKKLTRGREGMSQHRSHRPCSGCFSVLSEESQSMSWRPSEDDEVQPGTREVLSARMSRRGRGGRTQP